MSDCEGCGILGNLEGPGIVFGRLWAGSYRGCEEQKVGLGRIMRGLRSVGDRALDLGGHGEVAGGLWGL